MALQESVLVRNAANDAREIAIGAAPILEIRTGPQPVDCAAPDTGTLVAAGVLPTNWLTPSHNGVKTKQGDWTVTGVPTAGIGAKGGHFRIKQGGVCHQQGTFGYEADMVPTENWIASGQSVNVTTYSLTRGNA